MDRKIDFLVKGIKNPIKAARYVWGIVDNKFKLTETARVSGEGERLVIRDWYSAKNSRDFCTLAHIQRYEWVLPHVKGLRCLDAGCGSGYGTYYLANDKCKFIIGVDISIEAIKFARKYFRAKNLIFGQMDVCNLSFRDNSFDAVVSFDVLEHLDATHQEMMLSELARVLNIGGTLYIGCQMLQ
jgi:ubiquinone/menaquinone biosynthesis C-methylase UbiE